MDRLTGLKLYCTFVLVQPCFGVFEKPFHPCSQESGVTSTDVDAPYGRANFLRLERRGQTRQNKLRTCLEPDGLGSTCQSCSDELISDFIIRYDTRMAASPGEVTDGIEGSAIVQLACSTPSRSTRYSQRAAHDNESLSDQ